MKMHGRFAASAYGSLAALLAASAANAQQLWSRSADWVPGTTQGSTTNNPSSVSGIPIWRYETTQGGGLGSTNPWYAQQGTLMTWDSGWYQTGWGVWSNGDDANPPILAGRLIHNVHTSVVSQIPVVRWQNPMGNGGIVNINGSFIVNWNGNNGLGRPVDVDVVIAKYSAALNSTSLVFSTTVAKPNPFPSVGDSVIVPISISGIHVDQGDSLVITHRGQQGIGPQGAWVNLYDSIAIQQVPAPGAAGLLAMAGLAAARRRRRS